MSDLRLPIRGRGRLSAAGEAAYREDVEAWCTGIRQIRSTLDFTPSARGWCYLLEGHGLRKDEFDKAEDFITRCRKNGDLPFDITAEDGARAADHLEQLDDADIEDAAKSTLDWICGWHDRYDPLSLWENQDYYLEVMVEKIDLKGLFEPICAEFHIPCINARGWSDLWSRGNAMRRFQEQEDEGKTCVLLYCGDHDPAGLNISNFLHEHFHDLEGAIGWDPSDLIVDRFGLSYNFIEKNGLSWINNLQTAGSKYSLDDPRHPDHEKPYVQDYINQFGVRKCEANALVIRPTEGRQLFRETVLKYINDDAVEEFHNQTGEAREQLRLAIIEEMRNYDG